jgi:hypothetical protein
VTAVAVVRVDRGLFANRCNPFNQETTMATNESPASAQEPAPLIGGGEATSDMEVDSPSPDHAGDR